MSLPIISTFVILVVWYVVGYYRKVAKYPPGPTPLPLIGNMHQLTPNLLFRDFRRLTKQYGAIFTVFMPEPLVVLADHESVKEAMVTKGEEFVDRPTNIVNQMLMVVPNTGLLFANGPEWQAQRRVSIGILRDFGMGKNQMEQQVLSSIEDYLRFLDGIPDKERVDMHWPVQVMVANIINETLFGFRYAYDDCDELVSYADEFNKMLSALAASKFLFLATLLPCIYHIPFVGRCMLSWLQEMMEVLYKHVRKNIDRARQTHVVDEEPSCYVHAYIDRMAAEKTEDGLLSESQLAANCSDIFMAGMETTSTTLRWAMLFFAAHPDVQERIRAEVLSVVGADRLPSMADKPRMPYTAAAVHEVQRRANILPVNFSIFHQSRIETSVQEHLIPCNTMVYLDIHQILASDPCFENPEEFRPERYLAPDSKVIRKDLLERTIPFGLGKRQCAGEGLARVELFLGIVATLQRYRILPPVDGSGIDLEPQLLNIHLPKPHKLRLVPVV